MSSLFDFTVKDINGQEVALAQYAGQVAMVVNVASYCGYTPHYQGLQQLYRDYQDQGLIVMGFPCNDFGAQEPGSEKEIATFCTTSYGAEFPMFAKVQIKGNAPSPIYQFLGAEQVQWNFHKFLTNKKGEVVRSFPASIAPDTPQVRQAIELLIEMD